MTEGSIFLRVYQVLLTWLARAWEGSLIRRAGVWMGRNSRIFQQMAGPSSWSAAWQKSLLHTLLTAVLEFPETLFGLLARVPGWKGSLAARLAGILGVCFPWLLSGMAFLHLAIPHGRWKNTYALAGVILLWLLSGAYALATGRRIWRQKGFEFVTVLFVAWVVLCGVLSPEWRASLRFVLQCAPAWMLAAMIFGALRAGEKPGRFLGMAVTAAALMGLSGLYQIVHGVPVNLSQTDVVFGAGLSRIYSTVENPNNYAEILIMLIPLLMVQTEFARTWRMKIACGGVTFLALINIWQTQSRSGWMALALSMGMYLMLSFRRWIPLIAVGGLSVLAVLPASVWQRLSTVGKDSSSQYRLPIWKASGEMFRDFWLTGIGSGSEVFRKIYPNYSLGNVPAHAHMLPLEIAVENGLPGIALWLWMLFRFAKRALRTLTQPRNLHQAIALAAFGGICGVLVMGMAEYVWFYPRVMNTFWITAALLMAVTTES